MSKGYKPNEVVFDLENYNGGVTEMFTDIGRVLKILTNNGYICTFRCDEPAFQIYIIEFDYMDEEMGCPKPYWLTTDDYWELMATKEREGEKEEDEL